MKKKSLLFIPGGPWISGYYWDHFLAEKFSEFDVKRHILANHETLYNKGKPTDIQDALRSLKNDIHDLNHEGVIVAHSYGAWLLLLALDEKILETLRKIILVNMPVNFSRTERFKRIEKKSTHFGFRNNLEFQSYMLDIIPAYFHNENLARNFENLFNYVYMESNESMLITSSDLEKCLGIIRKIKNKVEFINSDKDSITGDAWKKLYPNSYNILGVGHFPMLEDPESFSETLIKIL